MTLWRRYLIWFAQDHVDFRIPEVLSIIKMLDIPIKYLEKPCISKPYLIVELPSENHMKHIASRCILIKSCVELWSWAKSEDKLHNNLKKAINNQTGKWIDGEHKNNICNNDVCPKELITSSCGTEKSFKVEVETFCKHLTMLEKVDKIEKFSYLPLKGPVNLKDPDTILSYIEFYGTDCNNVPKNPYDFFFGRLVARGQRDLIKEHSLKKRTFIGNTSMDAQLAIIMANQALVRPGHIILDPFVGSGSLLVAAAHFGAYVWGADLDYMILHARTRPTRPGHKVRTEDESIRSNLRQYGTAGRYLDVVVSDFSLPLWRDDLKFDAIITDPPYGVREATERIGIERDNYTLTEEHLENHVPAKVDYQLGHMYADLLKFGARHLQLGGRLVCWYPVVREEYSLEGLPSHPCLRLVANSEQVLTRLTARRLLTYERVADYAPHATADYDTSLPNFREKFFAANEPRKERKGRSGNERVGSEPAVPVQ